METRQPFSGLCYTGTLLYYARRGVYKKAAASVFFFGHICCSRDTNVILWLIAEWFFGVQKYPDGQMTVL